MNPEVLMLALEQADLLDRYPAPSRARPDRWLDPRVADALYGDVHERARAMRIAERTLPRKRNHGVTLADALRIALGMGCHPHPLVDVGEILNVTPKRPLSAERTRQILAKSTRLMGDGMDRDPAWLPRFPVREIWDDLLDMVPASMGRRIFPTHVRQQVRFPSARDRVLESGR